MRPSAEILPTVKKVVTTGLLIAIGGVGATACGSSDKQSTTNQETTVSFGCQNDNDCDGIANGVDQHYAPDPPDADGDGIPNGNDIYPYGFPTISPPKVPIVVTPKDSSSNVTYNDSWPACTYGSKPDADADGIPDWCDPYYDQYNKDTDHDGIPDLQEATFGLDATSSDTDGDGIPDGQDPEPDVNKYDQQRFEERQREERMQEQQNQERLDEQRREEERQYEQRQQENYYNNLP